MNSTYYGAKANDVKWGAYQFTNFEYVNQLHNKRNTVCGEGYHCGPPPENIYFGNMYMRQTSALLQGLKYMILQATGWMLLRGT